MFKKKKKLQQNNRKLTDVAPQNSEPQRVYLLALVGVEPTLLSAVKCTLAITGPLGLL